MMALGDDTNGKGLYLITRLDHEQTVYEYEGTYNPHIQERIKTCVCLDAFVYACLQDDVDLVGRMNV